MNVALQALNAALPAIIAAWKALKEQDPKAPTYTDEQVVELLAIESSAVVKQADEWLAQHPKP
jgi:hypothetical protein